jgi:signal transduction histidine kinase
MNDGGICARAPAPPCCAPTLSYSDAMSSTAPSAPSGFARIFAWRRLRFTLAVSAAFGFLLSHGNDTSTLIVILRAVIVGSAILLAFGLLEHWPKRLPKWLPRTVLRLIGIALAIPVAAAIAYAVTNGGDPALVAGSKRLMGYGQLVGTALLFAPWIAVAAILRQRDAFAREQAHAFDLERSEFERRVSDARLRLLQAQVEPHFLFNTLANVQALVDAGSPQASKVLTSLIAYLRAAVPRMQSQTTTLEDEVQLVRAYLELMQMRMPDRLQYAIHLDPAAARLHCPPMTLLTLVENAVRHGIDPSEAGGRIDADIWMRDDRCLMRVKDTGVGLKSGNHGLSTGLSTLRERLKLAFGGDAQLTLTEMAPHGVCAEVSFPGRDVSA